MHHRQAPEEPLPILPLPKMLDHGDEERSGPGRGCRGGLPCACCGQAFVCPFICCLASAGVMVTGCGHLCVSGSFALDSGRGVLENVDRCIDIIHIYV